MSISKDSYYELLDSCATLLMYLEEDDARLAVARTIARAKLSTAEGEQLAIYKSMIQRGDLPGITE